MKKIKKILFISMWILLFAGLVVSMGFVNSEQNSLICKKLSIKINQDDEVYFLDTEDIRQFIKNRGDSIVGQTKATINIPKIEHSLNSQEDIAKAIVYMSIDGELKVDVTQRKPIIRIINLKDESYYLDAEGKLMPLSDKYTANVLVANGNITEKTENFGKLEIFNLELKLVFGKDIIQTEILLLKNIYKKSIIVKQS